MTFSWEDYVVCGLMLLVSSGIGVYYRFTGGKQRTNQEFLLANNDANVWAVGFSLMATFMSSITLLGVSSEIYSYGTLFVIINISYGIFTPVAAYLYLPVFYKLKTTSAYEYLEKRFGVTTRLVASLAFSFQMILYMGIVVYAPSLALQAVTGIGPEWAVVIMGGFCTFYAGIGGMKAIMMADVFQSFLMFAAVFSVIVTACNEIGFLGVWEIAEKHQRIEFLNFDPDPTVRHTWWTLIVGGGFTFLSLYAVNQAQVQRYLSVKDLKTAQKSLFLNWPILSLLSFSTSFAGMCIFSKYYDCDPVVTGRIKTVDQLMPLYVLDVMKDSPGLRGLFVAGVFSGSLSTVSSALNSLSAVTVEDYVKPLVKRSKGAEMNEKKAVIASKLLCLVYGGCCLAVAFIAKYLGAVLQASLTIFGVIGGPLLATFTLGMFFPMANEAGSMTGLISGLIIGFWLGFSPKPNPPLLPRWSSESACEKYEDLRNATIDTFKNVTGLPDNKDEYFYMYRLSYQWFIVIAFIWTVCIGLLASWIGKMSGFKARPNYPELFVPPVAKYLGKKMEKSYVPDTESENSGFALKRTVESKKKPNEIQVP